MHTVDFRFVDGIIENIAEVTTVSKLAQKHFDNETLEFRFNLLMNNYNLCIKEAVQDLSWTLGA